MPDFKVIDGGGPEGRDQTFAEQELREALQCAAANLLRVVRGAGKPYELVTQFNAVVQASVQFKDAFGHRPPSHLLADILGMRDDVQELHERNAAGKLAEGALDRWYEDGTIDRMYAESAIKAGVLQIIASRFVDQLPQERAGQSEMNDGVNKAFAARTKSRLERQVSDSDQGCAQETQADDAREAT
jgi:hypothetical protein